MDYRSQNVMGNNPEYYYQQQGVVPQYQQQNYVAPIVDTVEENVVYAQKGLLKSWLDFTDKSYLKGFLLGVGVGAIVGHPKIRKVLIAGAVGTWDAVSSGFEELKEQVEDVRAEKNNDKK